MQKRTREIAALVLLALLAAGAAVAMGWYILAGHGWNVTASNIDDSIGQMDGYTVLLFEGTRQPAAVEAKHRAQEAARAASSDAASSAAARAADSLDGDAVESPAAGTEEDIAASDGAATSVDSAEGEAGQSPAGDADAAEGESAPLREEDVVDIAVDGDDFGIDALSESYREKGAEVYRIDVAGRRLYGEPLVVSRGEQRIGLFSLDYPARPAAAKVARKLLARQETDFNVVITNDPTLKDARLPGIDAIICDEVDEEPLKGYYSHTAYCVDTPYEGEIEAIIISPSGVVSSKTIGPS